MAGEEAARADAAGAGDPARGRPDPGEAQPGVTARDHAASAPRSDLSGRLRRLRAAPTFRSLRIHNYRLYAGGQLVSNTGTWMQRVAQDWLVVTLTGASGVAVGTTVALQALPMLLLGLWGGVIADRLPKRQILIVTRSAMGLVSLALGLLTFTGVIAVWHVYALAFVLGIITAIDNPTRQSFVMEVVGREDLPNAVGLNSATFNLARVVGPAVAGFMIGFTSMSVVLFASAATYLGMLVALARMRVRDLQAAEPSGRGRGQLREGLRYVADRPYLVLPIVIAGFLGTFGFNFQMMLALVAKSTFDTGAGSFGLLSTAIALGSLAGALIAASRRIPRHRVIVGSALSFGALEAIAGVMPSYAALIAVLVPTGIAALMMSTSVNGYLQTNSSTTMRGRVMALYVLVFLGGKPVGTEVLGWVGDALGARYTLIVAGGISLLATVTATAIYSYRQRLVVRGGITPRPHLDVRAEDGQSVKAGLP